MSQCTRVTASYGKQGVGEKEWKKRRTKHVGHSSILNKKKKNKSKDLFVSVSSTVLL